MAEVHSSLPLPHGSTSYAGAEKEIVDAEAEVLTVLLLPLQEDGSPSQQRTVSDSPASFCLAWS